MVALPRTAEVVVVGGGIVGASTLYHLAGAGCRDAVLVERETLAAGATSKSAGGVRAQFSDELNIRIGLDTIGRLERFQDEVGADPDFKQWGYLFLLGAGDVATFTESIALQRSLGVPSQLIDPAEAQRLVPGVSLEGIAAATFSPTDGYATPEAVVKGYARAAAAGGARVVQGCTVQRILAADGRVTGVLTDQGTVATSRVVCAAGIWSRELCAAAGLALPVTAEKRFVHLAGPGDGLPHQLPLTIDFATGFYFQRESNGLLFGGREQTLEALAPQAVQRLPLLAELPIRPGWWGWYGMSPDHNAIVGAAAEPEGLLYATGFSGHGFQQGPVVGDYLAALALGREPALDLAPFGVERFATGTARREANIV